MLTKKLEMYVQSIPQALYQADADVYGTETFTREHLQKMTSEIQTLIEKTDELFTYEGA